MVYIAGAIVRGLQRFRYVFAIRRAVTVEYIPPAAFCRAAMFFVANTLPGRSEETLIAQNRLVNPQPRIGQVSEKVVENKSRAFIAEQPVPGPN